MYFSRIFILCAALLGLNAWAELEVQAALEGRSESIRLRFPQPVVTLNERIVEWERICAARGEVVHFRIGAGELRRAALHQDDSGPGDVELFADFPDTKIQPMRIDQAFLHLRHLGVDVETEVAHIFGAHRKLDFFFRDQYGVANNGPYMNILNRFFEGMGDTSLNQLTYSPARNLVTGARENLAALARRRILFTDLPKAERLAAEEMIKNVKAPTSYSDTILRVALRSMRLFVDLRLNPNPNQLVLDKSFDTVLRGFEVYFEKAPPDELSKFVFPAVYLEQFLKLFRNRSDEGVRQTLEILQAHFPKTLEIFSQLGLNVKAFTLPLGAEARELKALQGTANYRDIASAIDSERGIIRNPFRDLHLLRDLVMKGKMKLVKAENVRPIPDWILLLHSPELYYRIQHFDELRFEDRLIAIEKYVDVSNYFCATAKKRIGLEGDGVTFREETFGNFSFLDARQVPNDKTTSLLDFIESQHRNPGRKIRTATVRFNRAAIEEIEKRIAAAKNPVIVVDLDATLYVYQQRVFQLLLDYDREHGTSYFAKIDPRHLSNEENLSSTLYRVLGPHCATFSDLSHLVENAKSFVLNRVMRAPALATDLLEPELAAFLRGRTDVKIRIVTARSVYLESPTRARLRENGFAEVPVSFRADDLTKPEVYKEEWLRNHAREFPDETVVAFFDDSRQVQGRIRASFPEVLSVRVLQRQEEAGVSSYWLTGDEQIYTAFRTGTKRCHALLGQMAETNPAFANKPNVYPGEGGN